MNRSGRTFYSLATATVLVGALVAIPAWRASGSATPDDTDTASEVCLDCHESEARAMMGTAHDPAGKRAPCLSCHAGAATRAHVDDPDTYQPVNPARMRADSLKAACTACHQDAHALNLYERDPHDAADLACTACHQIHDNRHAYQLKNEQKELCLSCHAGARRDFALTSRHPVMDGVVECMDCHTNVAQSTKQRAPSGPGEACVACHAEFRGPFPYEHEAAVEYSTEEGGCLNCHAAHGSQFPRLLKQTYQSPHFSLCSQCHSVPKHLNNYQHGTQWAGVSCNECHSDIHGSYSNRHLLDPSLQSQGCFNGCHEF